MVTVVLGLIRMKLIALVVGPAGIGILGILNSVVGWGATVFGLGIGSSAVREVAVAADDPRKGAEVRWALWSLTILLTLLCGLVIFGAGTFLPRRSELGIADASTLAWVAIAACLSIIGSSQQAELQGHRRLADLARLRIYSAGLGSAFAVFLVMKLGVSGIAPGLAAMGIVMVSLGLFYERRLPEKPLRAPSARIVFRHWRVLVLLGFTMTMSGFLGYAAQLAMRWMITADYGLEKAGVYQAVWVLSVGNLSIILAAAVADYFPRLSRAESSPAELSATVNNQLEILLLIGGPLLVVVTTFAPIELRLLFSGEFESGATVLRWHFAGDVFKLCVWSLSYLLIARKDVSFFLISEIAFNALHVGLYFLLSPHIGFAAAGVSYFVAMLAASGFLLWICTKRHPLQISVSLVRLSVIWGGLLMSLLWLSVLLPTQIVFALGLLASGFTGAWSYFRLRKLVGPFRANL